MERMKVWLSFFLLLAGLLMGCENEYSLVAEEPEDLCKQEEVPYEEELPSDYQGTLTMWGWDEGYYRMISEAFREKYPNVELIYTSVEQKDLPEKYETALMIGGELPDIAWSVLDSRGEIFELDMWEALEKQPYCFDISETYDYLHTHMVNSKGNVCGIDQSLAPAGLAYRRDLAETYLGTDDPKELERMMPDWESFIEKGKEVYEKSGGEVYMCFSLGDIQQFTQEQQGRAWADGKEIDMFRVFGRSLKLTERFRDEKIADSLIAWTPAWNQAFAEDRHIFTACAAWSLKFTIETYDTSGGETGRWGLMNAPEGNINWGGTAMGITKTCQDKRLAWEFLRFATLSAEGAKALNTIGLLTTAKKPYEENPDLKSYQSDWFGIQDVGIYYMDHILPNIRTRSLTTADGKIHNSLNRALHALNKDEKMTWQEALEYMKMELEEELPEYHIE